MERFLHVDNDGIIFSLTTSLLCIFDMKMLGDPCSCTWPEFLGKIPSGQK